MRSKAYETRTYGEAVETLVGELRQWHAVGSIHNPELAEWRQTTSRVRTTFGHMREAVDYGELCYEFGVVLGDILDLHAGTVELATGSSAVPSHHIRPGAEIASGRTWEIEPGTVEPHTSILVENIREVPYMPGIHDRELYIGGSAMRRMLSLETVAVVLSEGGSLVFTPSEGYA